MCICVCVKNHLFLTVISIVPWLLHWNHKVLLTTLHNPTQLEVWSFWRLNAHLLYNVTSLNVVYILQGDRFSFQLWLIYCFLLSRGVRLTFGIYVLCQDNKQGESLVAKCVPLFCAILVLIAKWGCSSLLQHLGLVLLCFISVYLSLTASEDAHSQPRSLKRPARTRPLLMSQLTVAVWPSTCNSFFLLNFYFQFITWLFFFRSKAPLKTKCVFAWGFSAGCDSR